MKHILLLVLVVLAWNLAVPVSAQTPQVRVGNRVGWMHGKAFPQVNQMTLGDKQNGIRNLSHREHQ